jgi:UDP-glucose 4-epimerase
MKQKPIAVVTGGAGFIGSHMVDLLLEKGFKVRMIDNLVGGNLVNIHHHKGNPDFVFEERDIRSYEEGDSLFKEVSYVFHFAGIGDIVPSIEKPREYFSVNIQGTVHMLQCAQEASVKKFIYAASSSCYGMAKTPTREDNAISTLYPYALSKYLGEQSAFHWNKVYGLPVNSLRIFNAYGTRSRTTGAYGAVFGVFLKQKIENKPFTVVGDGNQTRDFLYVTDVVKAFLAAANVNKSGEVYNLGAGNPQSVNKLVSLLQGDIVYIPKRPGEPDCTYADISKITAELGWKPQVSFEDGVDLLMQNIDYWRDAPLWDKTSIAKATENWFKYLS